MGIVSGYDYTAGGDFMNALTTPYGTTKFDFGESTNLGGPRRWLLATDPLGNRERLEYMHGAPVSVSESAVPSGIATYNDFLASRNSFYWDKRATAEACTYAVLAQCDYSKAHIDHWLHGGASGVPLLVTEAVLESEKAPLENRVWYNYPGQSAPYSVGTTNQPSAIARLLDDGSTQLYQYSYNNLGKVTRSVDPMGRTLYMEYDPANRLDLLKVWRKTANTCDVLAGNRTGCDLLATYTYNAHHLPLSYTDATGQTTLYSYNKWGQLTKSVNPLKQTTAYTYIENTADPNYRRLAQITRANQILASYSYDSAGRVGTVTDAGGYALAYAYDKLDRQTKKTFPDGTSEKTAYDKLEVASQTDRQGRPTVYKYNALRQLSQIVYPKNAAEPDRIVNLGWCACGTLESWADAKGQSVRWAYDLQGRMTGKFYPANIGNTPDEAYVYAPGTSRLQQVFNQRQIGANGQVLSEQRMDYSYFLDDNPRSIAYDAGGLNPVPTPQASFTYDPWYPRLTGFSDGVGQTQYGYYPAGALGAGQVSQEDGPWPNDTLQYSYDKLGRLASRQINGAGKMSMGYDMLGRQAKATNPLGAFTYAYLGATTQVTDISTQITSAQRL
jgi:YD repeat-containing protein